MTAAHVESPPSGVPDRRVRFIHTADWQLGMTRNFLTGDAQALYTAARRDAVRAIGELASSSGAEFVVVAGDVFEDHFVSGQVVRQCLDQLREFPVPVYLLPGNHDPLNAGTIYRSKNFVSHKPDNVTVLDHPGTYRVAEGVSLVAAPWSSKRPLSDLVADQVSSLGRTDGIRIVVGHGRTDVLHPESAGVDAITVATLDAAIDDAAIDYVALGDRHSTTSIGSTGRVWYSGAHEVTAFDNRETDSGNALVVDLARTSAGRSVDVTPHRVGQWRFQSITAELSVDDDLAAVRQKLESITDKTTTVVQIGLRGTVSVATKARLDDVLDEFAERCAALRIWDLETDLAVLPQDADFADLGLSGFVAEAADSLRADASGSDADAVRAQGALALLYRLARSS